MTQQERDYFKKLASELIREIQPPSDFKKFVDNSDVLGQYIEASVRQFIRKIMPNAKISTGSIISPEYPIAKQQIDTIIWTPSPYPAIFEKDYFAVIPRRSVFGILEIKSSDYTNAVNKIQASINSSSSLLTEGLTHNIGKGLICINTHQNDKVLLENLQKERNCFVLFNQQKDDLLLIPNEPDIISFIQYLMEVEYDRRTILKKPSDDLIGALCEK